MITHIVIWKYRADVEQKLRDEHVSMLRKLAAIIPEIKGLSVGFDVLQLPRSYDTGLVATFQDRSRPRSLYSSSRTHQSCRPE